MAGRITPQELHGSNSELALGVLLRNLYNVGYIRNWMVMDLSIGVNLALDHSIQLLHAYYQIPMSGIKSSTTIN